MVNSARLRNGLIWLLIAVTLIVFLAMGRGGGSRGESVSLTDIAARLEAGEVKKVVVSGDYVQVELKNGKILSAVKENGSTFLDQMKTLGVPEDKLRSIQYVPERPNEWGGILIAFLTYGLPVLLVVGLFYFILRQAQAPGNQAFNFSKSRARMFTGERPTVTFDDVAGVDEAKQELQEVVEFLKEPEKFIALGARIPKGVLLVGPPGTGKTLLAKAVSGEAGVPFFSISGSEFVEMFVGVGAARVRDLFEQAKRHSPCIVFIDEIDAVGRYRGAGIGGSHDEREQTLNQILVEMDGFDTDTNVIVMAATNRPDILDPALLRPGRFDRRVILDRPDVKGREAIFRVHLRGKPLDDDVDVSVLARATPGFVGADIANVVNEAAILAARKNKKKISMKDFEEAIEKVIAGPERKSRLITEREKRIIAYHEAGHAVVAYYLPNCDPVHKVTIIPRGMAGGYTLALPEEDRTLWTRSKFLDDMAMALGGRAAEEIIFGDITTGAAEDLERVTELARAMVTRYGMSEKLGPMVFGKKEELIFLGKEIAEQRDYSDAVAQEIDAEVRRLVMEAYERAKRILTEHRDKLEAVAQKLIEMETLDAETFRAIMEGRTPPERKAPGAAGPAPQPAAPQPSAPAPGTGPAPVPVPA
ncbi:ATP-dependent zinc metalloprotease FtsH [Thermoflexus sp.]|uniref:ATP-dependent zinc metalloprotease FtsH n=1 Tax=Thermoflexus sp. TaxID=1969742 RepID=UPI0035E4202B